MPLIDAHLHIDHKGRDLEATIEHVDELGADSAVFLPIEDPAGGYEWLSEYVEEAKGAHPDKVIPFVHVDVTREDAVQELERRVKRGVFVGYGEQKQHIPLNHPGLDKVLAFCNEMSWAVTFHFQEGRGGYNQGIDHLETLVRRYPKVRFIGHAQSWWANVSAEVPPPEETLYPKGPVTPGGLADRLLTDYENMFADLSAGSGLGALTRDGQFAEGFLYRHRKKLMFATDCPCQNVHGDGCFATDSLPYLKKMIPDQEALDDILHNNAVKIIGLE